MKRKFRLPNRLHDVAVFIPFYRHILGGGFTPFSIALFFENNENKR